jgi:Mos1 transposase-like protein
MNSENLKNSISDFEQRVFIKFGILQKKQASKIQIDLRKILGKSAYSKRTVRYWVQKINEGRVE